MTTMAEELCIREADGDRRPPPIDNPPSARLAPWRAELGLDERDDVLEDILAERAAARASARTAAGRPAGAAPGTVEASRQSLQPLGPVPTPIRA